MRIRRSDLRSDGIRRVRRGKGFAYQSPSGDALDEETLERVRSLVIPPAWRDVWICPYPNGHIQAVGTDAAGRRQYLYHPEWRRARDKDKHDRVLALAAQLPDFRRTVAARLRRPGTDRERVLAVALRLLEGGMFRTGSEQYQVKHGSHGVATLLRDHVRVSGDEVRLTFPSKSGQQREARLRDRPLARAILALKRSGAPGRRLLQYRDEQGWHTVGSSDVRQAFKELVGQEHTIKELRTWAATVAAAVELARQDVPSSPTAQKRAERAALVAAAEHLGNTPAVAGRSYVDPRVLPRFTEETLDDLPWNPTSADQERLVRGDIAAVRDRDALEQAVLRLLDPAASDSAARGAARSAGRRAATPSPPPRSARR